MKLGDILLEKRVSDDELRHALAEALSVPESVIQIVRSGNEIDPVSRIPVEVQTVKGDFEAAVSIYLPTELQPADAVPILQRCSRKLRTTLAAPQDSVDPFLVLVFKSDGSVREGSLDPGTLDDGEYRIQ